ncbi:phage head-tail connector protein [Enterococcus faecalis]|nr:phage head-tail connector protein [Enterococcus faecalis]
MTIENQHLIEEYKDLLDISEETFTQDKLKLQKIWSITEKQLLAKLKSKKVPESLDYIVPSIVVKRYNRIGHEGMKQHAQSEEKIEYNLNDFAEYQSEIDDYLEEKGLVRQRKVSFI